MAQKMWKQVSPRHQIPFDSVPTIRGSVHGGSVTPWQPAAYGPILDCVFEMADAVSTGNGISAAAAVEMVCKDENWRLLPSHKKLIIQKLES